MLWLAGGMFLFGGCGAHNTSSSNAPAASNQVAQSTPKVAPPPLEEVANYKYPPGTVLAAPAAKGQYSLLKVLRVERVKSSGKQPGTLFIHYRTYEELYPSLTAAKAAATSPHLKTRVAHGVANQGFLEHGVQSVAHVAVQANELDAYRRWRKDYDAGKADVMAF